MVVVDRVAEFVDDYIVAQMLREGHQKEAQRDMVASRTTPPLRVRGADREFLVFQPRRLRQPRDAARKVGLGGPAQLFDTGFPLLGRQLRRQRGAFSGEPFAGGFCDTPRGNDSRTAPVARTLIETRRARTDCESVTSPNRGCTQTEVIASAQH